MSTPLNWLRGKLRAWLGVPVGAQDTSKKDEPQHIKIHPSLMAQTLVKAGEQYITYRKVAPPVLPDNVRGAFVYDATKDPGRLGPPVLAMDDAQTAPAWAYLNQANCGMGFPGYGYLSELSQRSEYRAPVETIASEMTREFIDVTVKGKASKKKREKRGEQVAEDEANGNSNRRVQNT